MDPKHPCPTLEAKRGGDGSHLVSAAWVNYAGQLPQKALPRGPEDHGMTHPGQLFETIDQLEIVPGRLAEADPGVDGNRGAIGPGHDDGFDSLNEELADLCHHIDIHRVGLHRPWPALHVDQHDANPGSSHQICHPRGRAGGDVVDDLRAQLDGSLGYLGLRGIHRDDDTSGHQAFDHRQDPALLLVNRDRIRARPGRLPSYVDDRGTLFGQGQAASDRVVDLKALAAIREGIGRHVHDPDECALGQIQFPCAELPAHGERG